MYWNVAELKAASVSRCNNGVIFNCNIVLPRSFRLQKSKDIQQVIKKGSRFRAPHVQFSVFKTDAEVSRFAFIVSNKISKKATARNRTKRLMRESVRHLLPQLRPGFDIIIWASYGALDQTQAMIEQELRTSFQKMRLMIG